MAKRKKIVADMPSLAYPKTDLKKTTYVDESGVLHTYVHDKNQAVIKSITVFATVNDTEMGSVSVTGAVNGEAVVISYSDTKAVSLAATEKEGYSFVKWQSSSDGESYTDISGATSTTYTTTLTQAGEYYFKAVFEQESVGVDYLYFEAAQANSTVSMVSTLETAPNLEYSTDGVTWQEWQHTTADDTHTFDTIIIGAVGDKVYFRGDNPNGLGNFDDTLSSTFVLTGAIKAGGDVMSLLDTTMTLTEVPDAGFLMLFSDLTFGETPVPLLTTPDMSSITTIGDGGCSDMYSGCTSLTKAADMLNLTTINDGGCSGMYSGCTALTQPSIMQAVTTTVGSACSGMYSGCTALTKAADTPNLTIIGDYAFQQTYSGCTFNMTNDGTTLNFAFPIPPITTSGSDPMTFSTAYQIAQWMGNTNGFGGANQ